MGGELMVLGGASGRSEKIFNPPMATWRKWELEGIRSFNKIVLRKSVFASFSRNLYMFQGIPCDGV